MLSPHNVERIWETFLPSTRKQKEIVLRGLRRGVCTGGAIR